MASCAGSAPRPAPAPREEARAPEPAPEPPAEVALEDDPVPDGAACESTDECTEGQHCRGPSGCDADWACGAARECGETTVSYCGCDALTFYALEGCPGRPYQHVGPCEALGEEIAEADVEEVEGNSICTSDEDCRSGFVCAGTPGCGTFWTCVRRRSMRCTRDRAPFCSCGGETFFASSRCPGQPIAHEGYCAGDEPEEAVAAAEPSAAEPSAAEPPVTRHAEPSEAAPPVAVPPVAVPPVASRAEPSPARAAPPEPSAQPARSEPAACMSSRDCPRGQVCTGEPGCGTEWRCARPEQRCVADTQYFCGCDGESFRASMTCPGRPHRHRGSCPRE